MDNFKSLHMCDFCSREAETCGGKTLLLKDISTDLQGKFANPESVVACDIYESPVEVLKKKFH
jgi:hypothetical protein